MGEREMPKYPVRFKPEGKNYVEANRVGKFNTARIAQKNLV